jgi:hypothetical protein
VAEAAPTLKCHCGTTLQMSPQGSLAEGVAGHLNVVHGLNKRVAAPAAAAGLREAGLR